MKFALLLTEIDINLICLSILLLKCHLWKKELSGEWGSTARKFVPIRACHTGSVGISAVEVVVSSESRFIITFNIRSMEIHNVSAKTNLALI